MAKKPKPCVEEGCALPKVKWSSARCGWHWIDRQPVEVQVHAALWRLEQTPADQRRARVPERDWPVGYRFCAGCQSMVPLWYCRGSRCKACAGRAAHGQHIQRTYGLSQEEYDAMLKWQGGRCAVCRKMPRGNRRLAVDHDHVTGAVRGLLCANDEWGCNRAVLGVIQNLEMAQRVVRYYEKYPLDRMRSGEPPMR